MSHSSLSKDQDFKIKSHAEPLRFDLESSLNQPERILNSDPSQHDAMSFLKSIADQKRSDKVDRGCLRTLPTASSKLVDLATNDYLGITADSDLQTLLRESLSTQTLGGASSRLLGYGRQDILALESEFARFKGAESALYFSTGYAAGEELILALSQKSVCFFYDECIHASLRDGLRQSPVPRSRKISFQHNNLEDLASKLHQCDAHIKVKIIICESLYSMDGDFAPIDELINICQGSNAILVLDEAHALGLYGSRGQGLLDLCQTPIEELNRRVISLNGCGKAFGAQGGFICGPDWLKELMVNESRRLIFSTAPSPWLIQGLTKVLDIMPGLGTRRQRCLELSLWTRHELGAMGRSSAASDTPLASPIIPIILGDEDLVVAACAYLKAGGFLCSAIRHPTVPKGQARLRLSIHAQLDQTIIKNFLDALSQFLSKSSSTLH